MEIWDGYYKDGTLAGVDLVRGQPVPEGLYHIVCEALVQHVDGDYLLMRRSLSKPAYAGYYESSAGGSALKGEDSIACIKRELLEETGISSGFLEQIGLYISHNTIYYSYLCITDCPKDSITLQEGETMDYRWVSKEEFIKFINSGDMIELQKVRYSEYFKKIGFLKA